MSKKNNIHIFSYIPSSTHILWNVRHFNVGNNILSKLLVVSALLKLSNTPQEVKKYMTGCAQILLPRQLRVQLQIHILRNLGFIEGNMNRLTLGVS